MAMASKMGRHYGTLLLALALFGCAEEEQSQPSPITSIGTGGTGGGTGGSSGAGGTTGLETTPASPRAVLIPPPGDGPLCEQRFGGDSSSDAAIPHCSNVDINAPGAIDGVQHLVFVIHAYARTARDHFDKL